MMTKINSKESGMNFNLLQLNIVTVVNMRQTLWTGKCEHTVFGQDNNLESYGQGTGTLQTYCKQGQTLNWIIYPIDQERQANGEWPPSVKINNLVFLTPDGKDVSHFKVCSDLKVYGGPDKIRSQWTPVYYYWAGTILADLAPGLYPYRLVLEFDTWEKGRTLFLNYDGFSLNVLPISSPTLLGS
jgi:hypothetical protein